MNTTINIGILSVFIFLGVFQGFILSYFLIVKSRSGNSANLYQGLLLLALSICINEQFLNMTGLITRVLHITNTSEPLNLVIGPLLLLYVKRSLEKKGSKKDWLHFVLPALYLAYMCLDYVQPADYKYNSYVNSYHPGWPLLDVIKVIPDDPLGIKRHLNAITAFQILIYVGTSLVMLSKAAVAKGKKLFSPDDETIRSLRNMVFHLLVIIIIFIVVKLNFKADLGDYFIGIYFGIFTLLTSFRVMNDSAYFDRTATFIDITTTKYIKSSLTESRKEKILGAIVNELEQKEYFADNLASLSELAKRTGESQHHVSQVINEKLGKSFYELLAYYRIEKAKKILAGDRQGKITIEELSEIVGYNSKTAFNNSFRKLTGTTPSEYRKSIHSL